MLPNGMVHNMDMGWHETTRRETIKRAGVKGCSNTRMRICFKCETKPNTIYIYIYIHTNMYKCLSIPKFKFYFTIASLSWRKSRSLQFCVMYLSNDVANLCAMPRTLPSGVAFENMWKWIVNNARRIPTWYGICLSSIAATIGMKSIRPLSFTKLNLPWRDEVLQWCARYPGFHVAHRVVPILAINAHTSNNITNKYAASSVIFYLWMLYYTLARKRT